MAVKAGSPNTDAPPSGMQYKPDGGLIPLTDPTQMTTAQLDREIRNLRDFLIVRIDGVEKAQELFQNDLTRMPTQVDREVKALRELIESQIKRLDDVTLERFQSVGERFVALDKQSERLATSDKTAVNAALAAQEKQNIAQNESNTTASGKMEGSFAKLIDLQTVRIEDLKSRLDKGDGRTRGLGDGWALLVGGVGLAVAVVTVVLALAK